MLKFSKMRGPAAGAAGEEHVAGRPDEGHRPPDVANSLRRLRQQRGYSLETLARHSGVSRAMLGQIETGKSAPTITLLWKVAKALGVSVADLISAPPAAPALVLRKNNVRRTSLSDGRFSQHIFAPPGSAFGYEASRIEIAPGHREAFAPLASGAHATLVVSDGAIVVQVGDGAAERIEAGDSILFNADQAHSFANDAYASATAYLIVASLRNVGSK